MCVGCVCSFALGKKTKYFLKKIKIKPHDLKSKIKNKEAWYCMYETQGKYVSLSIPAGEKKK